MRDERGAARHIEQCVIGGVTQPPADRAAPLAVRRQEISGDCGVAYLANRPTYEVTFDAKHKLAHLVIIPSQNSVGQTILVGSGRDHERCPQMAAVPTPRKAGGLL